MPGALRTVARHALGWGFLLLGVAGLVLPVLQGWLFIAIGALLLSPDIPAFARLMSWLEARFPRLRSAIQAARRRIDGPHPPRSER